MSKKLSAQKRTLRLPCANIAYWTYNPEGTHTIVMVHGFRGNHHGLEDIIAELPPRYKVIVPDLPGFGASSPLKNCLHDIDGYVEFLKEFFTSLHLKKPTLLGHSFGSIVAAHFAAEAPTTIDKLILVNPIASSALAGPRAILTNLTVFYYWLGHRLPERAGNALLKHDAFVLIMSNFLAKTKDKTLRDQIHQNHLKHFSSFKTRDVVLESFKASVNHTASDKAERIEAPTLLIAGELDDIAPVKSQHILKEKIRAEKLIIIPEVGHLIHHEAPMAAANAIDEFLAPKS